MFHCHDGVLSWNTLQPNSLFGEPATARDLPLFRGGSAAGSSIATFGAKAQAESGKGDWQVTAAGALIGA